MIIFKHLLSNLHWWIFFSKDVSPPVYHRQLVPEVKTKVQERFRSCFTKKTGIDFEDKVNTQQVIEKIKLYKGDESNITTIVNLAEQCSQNSTYQSEFSQCMTSNMARTCIRKYISLHYSRWRKTKTSETSGDSDEENENTENYQAPTKKEDDLENDEIKHQIVSNEISADDNSKDDDDDSKNSYGSPDKNTHSRKGRSADDDDNDNDDDDNDNDDDNDDDDDIDDDDNDDDNDDDDNDDDDEEKDTKGDDARSKWRERVKAWKEKYAHMKNRTSWKGHTSNKSRHGSWKGWSSYRSCEQCFSLKPSKEMMSVFTGCWKAATKNSYMDKMKNCITATMDKKEIEEKESRNSKYMSKYMDGMWMKLFKPWSSKKTSLFFTEEMMREKQTCMFEKLGLGTPDKINKKGYTEMIKTHLTGDDKQKETLTKTVEKCGAATPEGKVGFTKFAECTLAMLETSCGIE